MFNPKQALGNKHHESCAFVPLVFPGGEIFDNLTKKYCQLVVSLSQFGLVFIENLVVLCFLRWFYLDAVFTDIMKGCCRVGLATQ